MTPLESPLDPESLAFLDVLRIRREATYALMDDMEAEEVETYTEGGSVISARALLEQYVSKKYVAGDHDDHVLLPCNTTSL